MLESVELKKRENRDDKDFLQMKGYLPCTFQLSSFQQETGKLLSRSERKKKKSCNKNSIKKY
jgi:hypothetical protein